MLLNAEGEESGHFVAPRDTEPAGSKSVPQAASSTSNVHTHIPYSAGTESVFPRTRTTRPYKVVGITSPGEVVARSIYSENDDSEDETSTCSSDTSSGSQRSTSCSSDTSASSQRSISDGNASTSVGSSTFVILGALQKNRQKLPVPCVVPRAVPTSSTIAPGQHKRNLYLCQGGACMFGKGGTAQRVKVAGTVCSFRERTQF